MFFATELGTVAHAIQLSVAPVFLLTAVSGMVGTAAGRLTRIIDRGRLIEDRIEAASNGEPMTKAYAELRDLRQRGRLVNACIALLILCAILIGVTIVILFLGETTQLEFLRLATISFLAGVSFFLIALMCFLTETILATRILKFAKPK
ncbi:MAG: DUF2721 domain-containing protein [Polaromonas sp.]|nr:DUF2721 domain-containing protein [Polaromonas sp.]MBP7116314.1 DUF2721 domain-containing protein [Polaromonas sp.]MBP7308212.1 DUF2721 domain-containing protein [Polaromonas sp.]MBP8874224.1 DUF2721 domain-containing protein [Polaromonas sp.]MBP9831633.1 DUF2721 domain-containing protein [Polaromonas sp.]